MIAVFVAVASPIYVLADDWTSSSISINFSGSIDKSNSPTDTDFSGVSGETLYGALPVKGDNWNNFQTHWSGYGSSITRKTAIKLGDGSTAQGVSAEWDTGVNYTITTSQRHDSIFHSFHDGSHQSLVISGLTAENGFPRTCTVYVYCGSDRSGAQFKAKTVNGKTYTFKDYTVQEGTEVWGNSSFSRVNELVLGGDYLKIPGVEIGDDGKVTISYAACSNESSTSYHGTLSAVQIDFSERSDYALSVNFSGGQLKNDKDYGAVSGDTEYGAVPVPGKYWFNTCLAKNTDGMSSLPWSDGMVHPATDIALFHESDHSYAVTAGTVVNSIFHSYLDDSPAPVVTIKGLTAKNGFPSYCRVYVYMSTDNNGKKFWPASVNGKNYTVAYNAVAEGTATWGGTWYAINNYLRPCLDYLEIGPVPVPASGEIVVSTLNLGTSVGRGGIAAVQVAFPVPASFTVSASCDANGTVAIGDGAAGASVSAVGTAGTPFVATMRATADEGYIFDHWEGPTGLFASGTATDTEVSVRTSMPASFKAVFVTDDTISTAQWTGGAAGSLADPANWICRNRGGLVLENALPTEDTTVVVSGASAFPCPEGTVLSYAAIRFDNAQLAAYTDWKGVDLSKVAAGSSIDLHGNTLELAASTGAMTEAWEITDTSAAGEGGELVLTVAEGGTFTNGNQSDTVGMALSGTLKFVKQGKGTFIASKAGQSYTGGTRIADGVLRLGVKNNPLGAGDKTQTVRIDKTATLDLNRCWGCFYNYELAGTINALGAQNSDAYNVANVWVSRIDLLDDAHITGKWFYFGNSGATDPAILNLNGKTLHMDITGYTFMHGFSTDDTGGAVEVSRASGVSGEVFVELNEGIDLSGATVVFNSQLYAFLGGGGAHAVKNFSYEMLKWGSHAAKSWISVAGVYAAGANRPPLELASGSTLDLSTATLPWSATGRVGNGKDGQYYTETGLVSFASGAQITVNLAGKTGLKELANSESPYLATWTAASGATGAKFTLDTETNRKFSLAADSTGLRLIRRKGLTVIVR